MALETVTYVGDLVAANPTSSDLKNQGDDHIRNIKSALLESFGGFTGAILVTGTDGGAVNAYTVTPSTALVAYSSKMILIISPTVTNTGASTVNVSGIGVTSLKSVSGAALVANDLVSGCAYAFIRVGTEFRLLSVTKNYIDQLAFSSALPAQVLGLLISSGAAASFSPTLTGFALNTVRATVASAATTADIWAAAGNEIDFTGTATVTNFPAAPVAGASRILHCAGACIFTNSANIAVQGAANYTAQAGDIVTVHAITTTTFRVTIAKASGAAVVSPTAGWNLLSTVTASNSATVDIDTTFDSTYDDYVIVFDNVCPATDNVAMNCRLKTGGSYNSGSNHYWAYANMGTAQVNNGGSPLTEIEMCTGMRSAASFAAQGMLFLSSPTSTSKVKGVWWDIHHQRALTTARYNGSGNNDQTTALTGVRFFMGSGNITTGNFRLYGIRKV